MRADLLVLDDLGAEKTSEWVEETLNLIVKHVDFPLQLRLAARVDQGLAALKLQFGDLGSETIAFDVEWLDGPRHATVRGRGVLAVCVYATRLQVRGRAVHGVVGAACH